ncbi:hypothetical protein CEXT_6921 [Caerostris extrusa]|uniref:Uncharacterized protein n=1 Tax=Caerostris extrusa TaxID=172846 RepID=A0AAV4UN37_CAEEX|nr:hypothetical protein CEXT_6921 [Caerostris extrusa]
MKSFKGFYVSDKKILRAEQQGLVSNSFLHRDNKRMFILNCFVQEDIVSGVGQISFWKISCLELDKYLSGDRSRMGSELAEEIV